MFSVCTTQRDEELHNSNNNNTNKSRAMTTFTICQICRMLSSEHEATTQSSVSFQQKSDTLLVWPPWTNCSNKGRPQQQVSEGTNEQPGGWYTPHAYQQLWRSVSGVFGALLGADAVEVPNVDTAVSATGCHNLWTRERRWREGEV